MIKSVFLGVLLAAAGTQAQPAVRYEISFANRDHHEARVVATFSGVAADTLAVLMSRSSPGRYALHEFAKNVYDVRAEDGHGRELTLLHPKPHQWNVTGHDGTVRVRYTVFGDRTDGTYLSITNTHAHLNMPATFMWARGFETSPIEVDFILPEKSWKVATQLRSTGKADRYTAADLQYFMDSPTEVSAFTFRSWSVPGGDRPARFGLALHHDGSEADADAYAKLCRRIVLEERAIYGELPRYDFGSYTFIADYLPSAHSDGMEHRNSTILTAPRSVKKHFLRNLRTVAHEFFHCWNVERIRPKSLEPFNFERANMSAELWFAEGFTSYYDALVLKRAQITSIDRFAEDISGYVNFALNAPGNRYFGPEGMSMLAPFTDAGVANDPRNFRNTFLSYYTYGSALGLALDLTLREQFGSVTLDDLMREMWQRHGKSEQPYTNEDVRDALASVTGSEAFAREFFAAYIEGREWPDFGKLLEPAGFRLRKKHAGAAWLGLLDFEFKGDTVTVGNVTLLGSPLYRAGIDRDDVLLKIDGQKAPDSKDKFRKFLATHKPGDEVEIAFEKDGRKRTAKLELAENPELEVVPFEHIRQPVSAAAAAFRADWLGSKAPASDNPPQRYCPTCKRAYPFVFDYCRFDGAKLGLTPVDETED